MAGAPVTKSTDVLYAGTHDVEDAYNGDTDRFDARKVKVTCPGCGRTFAALCSPRTAKIGGGWRWVGVDHRQPETDWLTTCRCGQRFEFTTYVPQ